MFGFWGWIIFWCGGRMKRMKGGGKVKGLEGGEGGYKRRCRQKFLWHKPFTLQHCSSFGVILLWTNINLKMYWNFKLKLSLQNWVVTTKTFSLKLSPFLWESQFSKTHLSIFPTCLFAGEKATTLWIEEKIYIFIWKSSLSPFSSREFWELMTNFWLLKKM